jgi:uncharacterized protein YndB with AHSA1/START domain
MDHTEMLIDVDAGEVWATLADASTFKDWVVGCKEVRYVEGDWPAAGSAIHHRVGVGNLTIDDTTSVEEVEPERQLVLRARARPAGVAVVNLTLESVGVGATNVVMEETIIDGPVSHVPDLLTDPVLHPRNVESLRRLKSLAEGRPRAS